MKGWRVWEKFEFFGTVGIWLLGLMGIFTI
jgi:hypothetical protein